MSLFSSFLFHPCLPFSRFVGLLCLPVCTYIILLFLCLVLVLFPLTLVLMLCSRFLSRLFLPLAFFFFFLFATSPSFGHVISGFLDWFGVILFFLGALLETICDLQRYFFHVSIHDTRKLFTAGLFSVSQHLNYFGYFIWRFGLCLCSGLLAGSAACSAASSSSSLRCTNNWLGIVVMLIPAVETVYFLFLTYPRLQQQLHDRHLGQYDQYQRRTARLIPGVW